MADILLDNQGAPSAPAASKSVLFTDSTAKRLCQMDDAGVPHGLFATNFLTASQALGTGNTYVTNSGLLIPSFGMKAGQLYRWTLSLSKTAAGVAAAVIGISIGNNQTTADTIRLTLTQAAAEAQSALVASALLTIIMQVRNVGASGVLAGGFGFSQTYQATAGNLAFGGGNDAVAAGFDNTAVAGFFAGLQINAGASSAWTITACAAELIG